jgi:tRNA(fMet)-specific endonuclease VapC
MIILDTDHLSVLKYADTDRCRRLKARLDLVRDEVVAISIVTVEEEMRGWMDSIAKERQPRRQVRAYRELGRLFAFFAAFELVSFTDEAVQLFEQFGHIHISKADKKIAAIALVNGALLLTANRRDYEQVPNLKFENWMDPPPAA